MLRVVRQEDGARVQLGLEAGTVWCWVARGVGGEPPVVGERTRARILGGVTFRADD